MGSRKRRLALGHATLRRSLPAAAAGTGCPPVLHALVRTGRDTACGRTETHDADPAALRSAAGVPQAAVETQGAKAALFKILGAAEEPLTSGAPPALQCCRADAGCGCLPCAVPVTGGAVLGVLFLMCCCQRRWAGGGLPVHCLRRHRRPLPAACPASCCYSPSFARATALAAAAAQVWEAAQHEGLRSKRHTKLLLQQLNLAGWVKTVPVLQVMGNKKHKSFGYRINEFKQQERRAAAAAAAPQAAAAAATGAA